MTDHSQEVVDQVGKKSMQDGVDSSDIMKK